MIELLLTALTAAAPLAGVVLPYLLGRTAKGLAPVVEKVKPPAGTGTVRLTRAIQVAAIWPALLALLSNTEFWLAVLPALMEWLQRWSAETLAGSGAVLVMSIVYEALRRVTRGPVRD